MLPMALAIGLSPLAGCGDDSSPDSDSFDVSDASFKWWRGERTRRNQAIDAYLKANSTEFNSFINVPLGHSGFPVVMMRVFPDLFPELWGTQEDKLSSIGFGNNPWDSKAKLPFGFGFSYLSPPIAPNVGLQVANLTCGACHVGRVIGPEGKVIPIVGAPNTQFDATNFFGTLKKTVDHPGYTVQNFQQTISAKPNGWFYGSPLLLAQEGLERKAFKTVGQKILDAVKTGVTNDYQKRDKYLAKIVYAKPKSPDYYLVTPGRADAFGLTILQYVDDTTVDELPPGPVNTDIMSVWRQSDRAVSHWGGEMAPGIYPVLAAEIAVAGGNDIINTENLPRVTSFLASLPAPPFPFDVDQGRAKRGEALFKASCASCHKAGDASVYPLGEVGTDPWRAKAFTDYTITKFNEALYATCPDKKKCSVPNGQVLTNRHEKVGYVATPLDGIWARAPYLHNGSVPTLRQLLIPAERPTKFYRGSIAYDQENVGFAWKSAATGAVVYDTSLLGQSNKGHDSAAYLGGIDWQKQPEKLADLIEYMKTL
jgi:mono/diheme cytochrome c family protein